MSSIFIFGLGYVGLALARELKARGWKVYGTSRKKNMPIVLDGLFSFEKGKLEPSALYNLESAHCVLSSIPPKGPCPLETYHVPIARKVWAGYLSSSSVYGDAAGAWVDEKSPVYPDLARGRERLAAELAWQSTSSNARIFRLAGIYGPKRNVLEKLQQGEAKMIIKKGHVFSRIHLDDLVRCLIMSMGNPMPGIYNVCDLKPCSQEEVICYAAALMGLSPPEPLPFEKAQLSPLARSFYADRKQLCCDKIRTELGFVHRYPSYKEGLRAEWARFYG